MQFVLQRKMGGIVRSFGALGGSGVCEPFCSGCFLTDTRVPRTDLEKRFPDILVKDLLQAVTEREKDRLTLGLF